MAAPARYAALSASLKRELDPIPLEADGGRLGKLRWLRDQLENYLDRWLAFAVQESIPMKSLLRDDLFAMVLAAFELYGQELDRDGRAPAVEEFRVFHDIFLHVSKTGDRASLGRLREAVVALGVALQQSEIGKRGDVR